MHKLDEQFDRLEQLSKHAPRPYYFVVLSDHGQSQGATFKQRYGLSLEELVRGLVSEDQGVDTIEEDGAAWGNLNVLLTDLLNHVIPGDDHLISRLLRRLAKRRSVLVEELIAQYRESLKRYKEATAPYREFLEERRDHLDQAMLEPYGKSVQRYQKRMASYASYLEEKRDRMEQFILGPYRQFLNNLKESPRRGRAKVFVLASGNLGLIYFTSPEGRMTYEEIQESFPNIIPGLVQHEGISFLLVRSHKFGPLAIGKHGTYHLGNGKVEGIDPLATFGPNAARHLCRADSFPHAADVLVNSFYDPETGEVAAFEELVGSHGGLGGDQSKPFVLFPAAWELQNEEIVGACELHVQLKHWLRHLREAV